jgi:hypothetical protein
LGHARGELGLAGGLVGMLAGVNKPAVPEVADLVDPEQRLVAAARVGQPRDLAGGEPIDAE